MSDAPSAHTLGGEDEARAQWYALISRLFSAPADVALLHGLAAAPDGSEGDGETPFLDAWRGLQAACTDADAETVRAEFDDLFVGVGKAPVTPYTSAYAASHAPDRHLLTLRTRLAEWGLSRRDNVFETEDHVAAVCDAMRWLIEQGRPLEDQRAFFTAYLDPAVPGFCAAIKASPVARFYRSVAVLAGAFHEVEKDAFEMHTES
jgi:TorA maturation chaperone TorD